MRENAPGLGDLRRDFNFTQKPRQPLILPTNPRKMNDRTALNQQVAEHCAASDDSGPVVMLNLLRFKDRADGIDAGTESAAPRPSRRYAAAVRRHLDRAGACRLLALRRASR